MSVREVLFVSRGSIPRTTSGKLQRGDLREAYLAGEITGLPTSA